MARANTTPAAPPPDPDPDAEQRDRLERFSAELAKRLPDKFIKRFVLPGNIREAREILMMEIDGKDEIAAAAMADATMSAQERASTKLAQDAERRESIRLAIVGLGVRRGGRGAPDDAPIDYQHVNADGVPFTAINTWTQKAWSCLYAYHGQLNGVPFDELYQGIAEARTVGAFGPPTSGTPESSSRAK
jgi:hypothetical protein